MLPIVSAVSFPELPDQKEVSVCVPGAYIKGIDIDGNGMLTIEVISLLRSGVVEN